MKALAVLLATGALALAQAPSPATFLIRGADVYPGNGPMQPGASILVENGRITQVGASVRAPRGVRVIEARGKRVYPGLIDSGTALGLSEVEQERMTVDTGELGVYMPQLRALSSINPASEHFPVVRATGSQRRWHSLRSAAEADRESGR